MCSSLRGCTYSLSAALPRHEVSRERQGDLPQLISGRSSKGRNQKFISGGGRFSHPFRLFPFFPFPSFSFSSLPLASRRSLKSTSRIWRSAASPQRGERHMQSQTRSLRSKYTKNAFNGHGTRLIVVNVVPRWEGS